MKVLYKYILGLILTVVLFAVGVGLLLNFLGEPASEFTRLVEINSSISTPTTPSSLAEQTATTNVYTPSTLDRNASEELRYLRCSFRITNKIFQPELLNPTSPAFTTLAQNLSTQVRRAYELSTLGQLKPKIQVLLFTNGSVVTHTLQSFALSTRNNDTHLDLQNTIVSIMQNRSLLQMVALPEIDPNSISVISYGDDNQEDHNIDCFHQHWLVPGEDPTQITLPNQTQSCSWQFSTLSEMQIFLELRGSGMNSAQKCPNTISFYVDVIPRNNSLHTRACLDTLEKRTLLLASNFVLLVWKKLPGQTQASSITARAVNLKACRQNITLSINGTSEGIVETPMYPDEYPDNINCRWTISMPERDYDLELSFIGGFVARQNDSCRHGHWLIDGQMYCMVQETGLSTMHVEANDGRIHLEFVCENCSPGQGMRILYQLHTITEPCTDSFKCNNSNVCGRRCDGIIDCKDGDDEHDCGEPCSAFTFRCGTGEGCITKVNPKCDGIFDCNNGIDEQNCSCGHPSIQQRIIGGQNSILGRWPWQAAMHQNNFPKCGATLISDRWLVTAAHCISGDISSITVYLGRLNRTQSNSEQVSRKVKRAITHPKYNSKTIDYDVALLYLKSSVTFSSFIQPACLPASSHLFATGQKCWVTGWGATKKSYPSTLQELEISVISDQNCSDLYSTINDVITPRMMCAGFIEGGKDSCYGDSGGPLACQSRGTWFLAGIVSWGYGCAEPNFPGVYTRVTSIVDWIKQNTIDVQN